MTFEDISTIEPCEICSIRPPTENCSPTFRLTRNAKIAKDLFWKKYLPQSSPGPQREQKQE